MLLSQALGRNMDRLPVIYSQGAVKLLLCARWSPHTSIPSTRHERHWSNMENSETLVSHPLSLSHSSSSHPAPLLHHVCSSPQAQNRRNRRQFGFHDHRPPQSKQEGCKKLTFATKEAIKNLLFQKLHPDSFENGYFQSFLTFMCRCTGRSPMTKLGAMYHRTTQKGTRGSKTPLHELIHPQITWSQEQSPHTANTRCDSDTSCKQFMETI